MKEFIKLLREEFEAKLQAKTGWGRVEVLREFEASITSAMVSVVEEYDRKEKARELEREMK